MSILKYAWWVCYFWGEFWHSWVVGMDKLFFIVSVNQLGQGKLSLLPEFHGEIFWDSYGFGYDSVMLGKNYRYALQW